MELQLVYINMYINSIHLVNTQQKLSICGASTDTTNKAQQIACFCNIIYHILYSLYTKCFLLPQLLITLLKCY